MERTVDVATGESVAFSYELAGLGSRFLAVFVDIAIQLAIALAASGIFVWLGFAFPAASKPSAASEKIASAILGALAIAFAFVVFVGYFIIFEWRFEGRTPGKRLLGIRVVRDGGLPLDFTSALVRNAVRILEFGLGFYALSAVSTLLSPENRRLGDYAAGTLVVRDHRYERFADAVATGRTLPSDPVVSELSAAERDLVRRYVARLPTIRPEARAAVAAQIALAVRPKLGANFSHLDDMDLLVHLARTALATS